MKRAFNDFSFSEMHFENLPDADPDLLCNCGECDGYFHKIGEDGRAEFCRAGMAKIYGIEFEENSSFEDLVLDSPVKRSCQKLLENFKAGKNRVCLILLGANGCGKTACSLALCKAIAGMGFEVKYVEWSRLISWRRAKTGDETFNYFWLSVDRSALLVVDEIGRMDQGEKHFEDLMNGIIGSCCDRQGNMVKNLVLISNMDDKEFFAQLPDYARSRIQGFELLFMPYTRENDLRHLGAS